MAAKLNMIGDKMSTGIGNHKLISNTNSPYSKPKAECPYCSSICEADFVDIGVGNVQCSPYYCLNCGASEISYLDTKKLTEIEKETGWYEPNTPVSENANTCDGVLVDHKTAKQLYNIGLLDKKRLDKSPQIVYIECNERDVLLHSLNQERKATWKH